MFTLCEFLRQEPFRSFHFLVSSSLHSVCETTSTNKNFVINTAGEVTDDLYKVVVVEIQYTAVTYLFHKTNSNSLCKNHILITVFNFR